MPIDLAALSKKGAMVEVRFYGETSEVWFDPTVYTAGFRAWFNQLLADVYADNPDSDEIDERSPYAEALERLLLRWDIVGRDGKPLPLTAKTIMDELPLGLITAISIAVMTDMNTAGNAPSSNNSSSTSPPAERLPA